MYIARVLTVLAVPYVLIVPTVLMVLTVSTISTVNIAATYSQYTHSGKINQLSPCKLCTYVCDWIWENVHSSLI